MATKSDPRETHEWAVAKRRVLKRDQYRCQSCGMNESELRGVDLHVHHIRAVKDGGGNDPENLVVLCDSCHNSVHQNGPEGGEYPPTLASERSYFVSDSRDGYEPSEMQQEIISLLQENGPMQKKDIEAALGIGNNVFRKAIDHLKMARYVGRVRRGVYAYISRDEYERIHEELANGKDPRDVRIQPYEPEKDDTQEESMADRTTITVSNETKEALDEHRDGRPWDAYLHSLIQTNSDESASLTEDHIDDIVSQTAERAADEIEGRMR